MSRQWLVGLLAVAFGVWSSTALSQVATELRMALGGKKELAVFWKEGRVVGLVEVNPNAWVSAEGATQVTLILNGQERTLQVHHAGSTLVDVSVSGGRRVWPGASGIGCSSGWG